MNTRVCVRLCARAGCCSWSGSPRPRTRWPFPLRLERTGPAGERQTYLLVGRIYCTHATGRHYRARYLLRLRPGEEPRSRSWWSTTRSPTAGAAWCWRSGPVQYCSRAAGGAPLADGPRLLSAHRRGRVGGAVGGADRQTDRQTGRQADRHRDRQTCAYSCIATRRRRQ